MPKALNSVALIGDFYDVFPDLKDVGPEDDRVPERDLAEFVAAGLRQRGFEVSGPVYEEPFLTILCRSGSRTFQILNYIIEPRERDSVWAVDCLRSLGILARLFGQSEEEELTQVVLALHAHFSSSERIRTFRWFNDIIPHNGIEEGKGYGHPMAKV